MINNWYSQAVCKDNNVPIVISGSEALPTPNPICSVEADMRIWRHVAVVNAHRILVYSPDTDVYNIGTAVAHIFPQKDVIVQVNVAHSRDLRYNIPKVLENDPDVASLPPGDAVAIFYSLYPDVTIYHTSVDLEKEPF